MILNKKARHDYEIVDTVVAGVMLQGNEVKSLRQGRGSLRDAYVKIMNGEVVMVGGDIPQYSHAAMRNYDSRRTRKLLLNKKEILAIEKKMESKNLTLVPLKLFFRGRWVKLEIGLARGKKEYEKREAKKKKDVEREVERTLKEIQR